MVFGMFVTFVAMVLALAVAGLVVAYVAFVSRGREIPHAPWLTRAIRRAVERWGPPPGPAEAEDPDDPRQRLHVRHGGLRRPSGR